MFARVWRVVPREAAAFSAPAPGPLPPTVRPAARPAALTIALCATQRTRRRHPLCARSRSRAAVAPDPHHARWRAARSLPTARLLPHEVLPTWCPRFALTAWLFEPRILDEVHLRHLAWRIRSASLCH